MLRDILFDFRGYVISTFCILCILFFFFCVCVFFYKKEEERNGTVVSYSLYPLLFESNLPNKRDGLHSRFGSFLLSPNLGHLWFSFLS